MRDVLQVSGTYDPNGDVDLTGFADSMTTYAASVAALLLLGRTTVYELPENYSVRDLAVGGIATHKLSRLVAKTSVTSPIRAPFTKFKAPAGAGEHQESTRRPWREAHGRGAPHLPVLPGRLGARLTSRASQLHHV
jgi:hypothetical protein